MADKKKKEAEAVPPPVCVDDASLPNTLRLFLDQTLPRPFPPPGWVIDCDRMTRPCHDPYAKFLTVKFSSEPYELQAMYRRQTFQSYLRGGDAPRPSVTPTGLVNLNNTCYMNGVVQCLAALPDISSYFSTNAWALQLNASNRLGSKGLLLGEFARLMGALHCGRFEAFAARDFKYCCAQLNSLYEGGEQNDAHEFLLYVLDKLHEDTNLVHVKQAFEPKELDPSLPDEESARITMGLHRLRDHSYVENTVLGMTKSTLWCPECHHVAVQFDVSKVHSIPVQNVLSKYVLGRISYVPPSSAAQRQALYVRVPRAGGTIATLRSHLARYLHKTDLGASLTIASVDTVKFTIKKIFKDNESLAEDVIHLARDNLVVYDTLYPDAPVLIVQQAFPPNVCLREGSVPPFPVIIPMEPGTMFRDEGELRRAILAFLPMCDNEDKYDLDAGVVYPVVAGAEGVVMVWRMHEYPAPTYLRHESYDEVVAWITRNQETKTTLLDCLRNATAEEQIDETTPFKCGKCSVNVRAMKQTMIYKSPTYLVLHLKRFAWSHAGQTKIHTNVVYPLSGLSLAEFMTPSASHRDATYSLVGVILHIGNSFYGHYEAFVRREGKWFLCDDHKVTEVEDPLDPKYGVVQQNAYVLFYARDVD